MENLKAVNKEVSENFQLKAYTKLMENLEVGDGQSGIRDNEPITEIASTVDNKGHDVIFANHSGKFISYYMVKEGMGLHRYAKLNLQGSGMIVAKRSSNIHVAYLRNGLPYYASEISPNSGSFSKEASLPFDKPKGFVKVVRLCTVNTLPGFACGIISLLESNEYTISVTFFSNKGVIPVGYDLNIKNSNDGFNLDYDYKKAISEPRDEKLSSESVNDIDELFTKISYAWEEDNCIKMTVFRMAGGSSGSSASFPDGFSKVKSSKFLGYQSVEYDEKRGLPRFLNILKGEKSDAITMDVLRILVEKEENKPSKISSTREALFICPNIRDAYGIELAKDTIFEYFVLADYLYHANYMYLGDVTLKGSFLPIAKDVSAMCISQNEFSNTIFYVDSSTNTIVQLDFVDLNWRETRLEVLNKSEVVRQSCYSTELTFLHPYHTIPLSDIEVTIWTDEPGYIETDGKVYPVSDQERVKVKTNAAGKLYILQKTTELDVPLLQLSLTSEYMNSNQVIAVNQVEVMQKRFSTINKKQLLEARKVDSLSTGEDGKFLLPDKYRTEKNADALEKAIGNLIKIKGLFNDSPWTCGVYFGEKSHVSAIKKVNTANDLPCWSLSCLNGQLNYESLTSEEAHHRMEAIKEQALANGVSIFDSSIADFFRTATKGIIDAFEFLINGAKALIRLTINGVKIVINAVIETIGDILDCIESIFTAVKVFFKDLFGFLGFLFKWSDVLLTKEAIKGIGEYCFEKFIPNQAEYYKNIVLDGIKSLDSEVSSAFQELIKKIGPSGSPFTFTEDNCQLDPQVEYEQSNDVIGWKASSADIKVALNDNYLNYCSNLQQELSGFMDIMNNLVDPIINSKAFSEAKNYFSQEFISVEDFFKNCISGILKVIEGIIHLILNGVSVVVEAAFNLCKNLIVELSKLLKQPINIPYISDVYYWISESKLTLIDFIALIVSIPSTLIYKLLNNKAPFSNNAEKDNFIRDYINYLNGTSNKSLTLKQIEIKSVFAMTFGMIFCLKSLALDLSPGQLFADGLFVCALEFLWFVFSCASGSDPDIVKWLCGWFFFGCVADLIITCYTHKYPDAEPGTRFFTSGYGMIHIILATIAGAKSEITFGEFLAEISGGLMEGVKCALNVVHPVTRAIVGTTDIVAAGGQLVPLWVNSK